LLAAFEAPATEPAPPEPSAVMDAPAEPAPSPRPLRRTRRTIDDLGGCMPEDPSCAPDDLRVPGLHVETPSRRRSPAGAAALGFLIGFGTGSLYAGDDRVGVPMAITDALLWLGFGTTMTLFTQLVVDNDFEKNRSLRRGERDFGQREERLYAASWVFGAALVGTHLFQGISALRAARAANLAVIPASGGAMLGVGVAF
jgi:hypothetical protein